MPRTKREEVKNQHRPSGWGFTILFIFLGSLIMLFIVVPLFKLLFLSDKTEMWRTLMEGDTIRAVFLTVYAALIAVVIGFVLGVPLAYIFARHEFPGKSIVEGLVDLPVVVPHSAAGIALLFVFGSNFLVGKGFRAIGIQFLDSVPGIVIAMLFVSVPILISAAKQSFRAVDVRLENVARTLGATPWQTFFRISFPLAARGIVAGSLMMWARAMSEFGAVVILAYHPTIAPVLIFERFQSYGLGPAVSVAAIMMVVSISVFVGVQALLRRKSS